jgi:hypothetical protein
VGNAAGVFQVGDAHVFSIAQSPCLAVQTRLGFCIVEAAARPLLVVLLSPICDLPASVEQVGEPIDPQALFAKLSVEATICPIWRARSSHGLSGRKVRMLRHKSRDFATQNLNKPTVVTKCEITRETKM